MRKCSMDAEGLITGQSHRRPARRARELLQCFYIRLVGGRWSFLSP
jgi:hypothetical protein